MIVTAILIAEVAFWVFLVAGLAARYVLRRHGLGLVLLLGSPAADLALLALTAADLQRGAAPTQAHALAAMYLGFTVAFGHDVVRWVDQRFAHRYADAPAVAKPHRTGGQRAQHEWREFRKAALAWAVAVGLLLAMSAPTGDVERALPMLGSVGMLTLVLGIWFVAGPVATSIAAARTPSHPAHQAGDRPRDLARVGTRPRQEEAA
ncbi:MAG: hypothetical protein ACRDVN_08395 [Jiangellaceae bacterium]